MVRPQTLLRMPELVKEVKPLVSDTITHDDIFRLIGTGEVVPFGYIQRIPVFALSQINEVASNFQLKEPQEPVSQKIAVLHSYVNEF